MATEKTYTRGIYAACDPDDSILLAQEPVELTVGRDVIAGAGEVRVVFVSGPRVVLELVSDGMDLPEAIRLFSEWQAKETLRLVDTGISAPVVVTRKSRQSGRVRMTAVFSEKPVSVPERADDLSYVEFHLVNFWAFRGRPGAAEERDGETRAIDLVTLQGGPWRVRINSLWETKERVEIAKERGFAITHAGRLERADGGTFSSKSAEGALTALDWLLSFARGAWNGVFLPVGFDTNGRDTWRLWKTDRVDPWSDSASWFDRHHPVALEKLFPEFWDLTRDPRFHQSIYRALGWYLTANRLPIGVDTVLILDQAALEILSWFILVDQSKTMTESQFKKVKGEGGTAEVIGLLLDHIGIGRQIPSALSNLEKAARSQTPHLDGPEVLVRIRNDLVHPKQKRRDLMKTMPLFECWQLSQHYVELSLLHHFRYQGEYFNRTTMNAVGQAENVPWAP